MRKLIIFLAFLLAAISGIAQDENNKKVKDIAYLKPAFHSINTFGILEGQNGISTQLQTVNGFEIHKWFTGIGIGLDHYSIRTIPVFLDIRKNLTRKSISPFLYADGGMSYTWLKKNDLMFNGGKYTNGAYFDGGIGYSIATKKSGTFIVSAGYSQKSYTVKQSPYIYIDIYPSPPYYPSTYHYTLRRLSLKIGWEF